MEKIELQKIINLPAFTKNEAIRFNTEGLVAKITGFTDYAQYRDEITDAIIGECIESDLLNELY